MPWSPPVLIIYLYYFALDTRLLVFSGVVFGVFGQVAEISRNFNSFGYLGAFYEFKFFESFFKLLIALFGKYYFFAHL